MATDYLLPFTRNWPQNARNDLTKRVFDFAYSTPSRIDLEAEARGQGNWQFFVVLTAEMEMGSFAVLMQTSRYVSQQLRAHFYGERDFRITVVSGAPPPGLLRLPDPTGLIGRLRRLEIDLTPRRDTRSRSDVVVMLETKRGLIDCIRVDVEPIDENRPFGIKDGEIAMEAEMVEEEVQEDLWATVPRQKGKDRMNAAALARMMTVLDGAMRRWGVLVGREWLDLRLQWMNHVNLEDGDVDMSEGEDESERGQEGDEGMGHDDGNGDETAEHESVGSEMSVDDALE